ncbi:hypothetical protein GALMADRAFT_1176579 [Galerina marginata CBS 339.88]|uniref:F-box domain-containing protein n=1 Tax=Galerina marginata (strain CBS 339.88) TaxID=685588 RepID=A0A067TA22_GALM3|nr:hypothetical protein GALMADRAFT_1176579 [Galerina marginata CBS 339.88]
MNLDGLQNLPNETITDIFIFCLPQESFLHPDPRNAPILLTHICSSWRAFVTQVPALWKSIALSDFHKKGKARPSFHDVNLEKQLLDQVILWNTNSRTHELAVSVDFRLASIPEVVQLQGKSSIVSVDSPSFWDTVLRHAIVENSHRLRKLFFQFESIILGNVIYDMTSECFTTLETLHFALSPIWEPPVIAARLKEFSITIDTYEDIESVLATIQFPALNHLRFCWDQHSGSTWSFDWTLPFKAAYIHFVNQLKLLHSLTLGFQNISGDALLEILRYTPLLVDLTVDSELLSYRSFLENLTYRPESAHRAIAISFTNDAFTTMLVSRSPILMHSTNGHHKGSQPAYLKNVLLCVEWTGEDGKIVDLENLSTQLDKLSVLGLGVDVKVEVSDTKESWLREESPTWC